MSTSAIATLPLAIVLLGPPGSGKGTHAVFLSQNLKIPHISTGDLLREQIREKSPLGVEAQHFIDQGHLVPDSLVEAMLFERLSKKDCEQGFILDGFPRTIAQAKSLEEWASPQFSLFICQFQATEESLIERITGRLICKGCAKPYHKTFSPPSQTNICDDCRSPLYQRKDDTKELLKERLIVYGRETAPISTYFSSQDSKKIFPIDSNKPPSTISFSLLSAILLAQKEKIE